MKRKKCNKYAKQCRDRSKPFFPGKKSWQNIVEDGVSKCYITKKDQSLPVKNGAYHIPPATPQRYIIDSEFFYSELLSRVYVPVRKNGCGKVVNE